MNPFDFTKPPPGTPDDPAAMQTALSQRPIREVFQENQDVPQGSDAGKGMRDPASLQQLLSYDPEGFRAIPWADGRGDGGSAGMDVGDPNEPQQDDALEQAYLQSAQKERDASVQAQEQTANSNIQADQESRRKLGL